MHGIAQTNLQLYNQLGGYGWPDADLARVRHAYELATDLFAGQLRPSGKPFVAHLVGAASAVAATRARIDLVLAALLHAAYTHGEFGDGRRGPERRKRAVVRATIGSDAETLVQEYATLAEGAATIERWLQRGALSPRRHDLAVLRLANEIDEHADLGTWFYDRGTRSAPHDATLEQVARWSDRIDEPVLADLARQMLETERPAVSPVLRSSATRSVTTAPRSHRLRFALALRRTRAAAWIRRVPMARRLDRFLRRLGR
jgi:hypothetical protein